MSETTAVLEQGAAVKEAVAKLDVLDQLLKPEVQQAITALVDQLPKLAEMMTVMTGIYDLAQKVSKDRVLIQDTLGGFQEVLKPLGEKVKDYASAAIEANDRADQGGPTIGVFGMVKLLKDPELQRMLRFGQAYLDILGERKSQQ
ncbi:uncharacterized protein YjgD (DUF1641 family) [Paenibacillus taihuensis]|uniref:Uncharacterized protein YjgD (DUF1641 family) n=1 Tax=Paenibacillus taihuensis TaxID=1156355 RepID=A0A3D9SFG8_9BACL|nr:DUF1641 domain-containing protein [Paenibacillus taihuensis]REE94639.1 uncharacterized protein YjgD (DUF1641 family) [Paenibacillus taihuensis]